MNQSSPSCATSPARARLDLVGVVASTVCLVHCLATPLVVASLPLVADAGFEGALVVLLAGFASLSALLAAARGRVSPALTCSLGLALLVLGRDLPEGSPDERVVVVTAACLMIVTHLLSLASARTPAAR